jgi:RNA polymerase nonessential primary-like sigma factor
MRQTTSLTCLLNDYGKRQVPSPSEELHWAGLVRRWLDHPGGPDCAPAGVRRAGLRARNRLVEGNVRWVVAIAKKHCKGGYEEERLMECIQFGIFGLIRAIERFEPTRGYKLSTFSYFWILQAIQRGEETRGTIRVPDTVLFEIRKLSRAAEDLRAAGLNPTTGRLSAATGIPASRVRSRIEGAGVVTVQSLDSINPLTEDQTLLEVLPAENSEAAAEDLELELLKAWLDTKIHVLTNRQRQVWELARQGLPRRRIAEELDINISAVGAHQKNSLTKLRLCHASRTADESFLQKAGGDREEQQEGLHVTARRERELA